MQYISFMDYDVHKNTLLEFATTFFEGIQSNGPSRSKRKGDDIIHLRIARYSYLFDPHIAR